MQTYRGFVLHRGRTFQDWRVDFPGRARWGTLKEVKSDVDSFLDLAQLPTPKRAYL